MTKKKEIVVEEITQKPEDLEIQTTFNKDGMDVLCSEDTIIENVEDGE